MVISQSDHIKARFFKHICCFCYSMKSRTGFFIGVGVPLIMGASKFTTRISDLLIKGRILPNNSRVRFDLNKREVLLRGTTSPAIKTLMAIILLVF